MNSTPELHFCHQIGFQSFKFIDSIRLSKPFLLFRLETSKGRTKVLQTDDDYIIQDSNCLRNGIDCLGLIKLDLKISVWNKTFRLKRHQHLDWIEHCYERNNHVKIHVNLSIASNFKSREIQWECIPFTARLQYFNPIW